MPRQPVIKKVIPLENVVEVTVEDRRAALPDRLVEFAHLAITKATDAEKGSDAQAWITAGAIAIDKLRLELGEATSHSLNVSASLNDPRIELAGLRQRAIEAMAQDADRRGSGQAIDPATDRP